MAGHKSTLQVKEQELILHQLDETFCGMYMIVQCVIFVLCMHRSTYDCSICVVHVYYYCHAQCCCVTYIEYIIIIEIAH